MNVKIDPSWKEHIGAEFGKPYFEQLTSFVRHEYATQTCYPPEASYSMPTTFVRSIR